MALARDLWESLPGWCYHRSRRGKKTFLSEIDPWSVGAQGAILASMHRCADVGFVVPCVERLRGRLYALRVPLDDEMYVVLFADRGWPKEPFLALHAFRSQRRTVAFVNRVRAEMRLMSVEDAK